MSFFKIGLFVGEDCLFIKCGFLLPMNLRIVRITAVENL